MSFISKNNLKYELNKLVIQMLSTISLVILWIIVYKIVDKPIIVPSPKDTINEVIKIVSDDTFFIKVLSTLKRIYICFFISLVLGVALGFISSFSNKVYYLLNPILLILKSIPTMAITLIAIIWLSSTNAPILVGFLVIFPLVYNTTLETIKNVDNELLEMATVYKFSFKKKLINLYIPSVKQTIINTSTSYIGLLIKVVIAAEILVQPKISIGNGFHLEKIALNTAGIFAWCSIVIVLVSVLEYLTSKFLILIIGLKNFKL